MQGPQGSPQVGATPSALVTTYQVTAGRFHDLQVHRILHVHTCQDTMSDVI